MEAHMPLTLNCGLTRKVGDSNFGSRGASVNLAVELESSLVTEPAKLQEKIRQLFAVVRTSLNEELNGGGKGSNAAAGGSNAGNLNQSKPPRLATAPQVKAIAGLLRAQGIEPGPLLQQKFKAAKPEDLSVQQASALITDLKRANYQPAQAAAA
jgi:hypothetical protein